MADENRWKKRGSDLRRMESALAVPSVFLGGPLAGALLGWLASLLIGHRRGLLLAGILLGFGAAIYEIVRTASRQPPDPDKDDG